MVALTNRRASSPSRSAVTLIETVLVVTLLAASALSVSVMLDRRWVARRAVTSVTNDVANSLIAARQTAVLNQAEVSVRPVTKSGNLYLELTEAAGPHRGSKSSIIDLGSEVRMSGQPNVIRFSPVGSADRGLRWTVRGPRARGVVIVGARNGNVRRRLP